MTNIYYLGPSGSYSSTIAQQLFNQDENKLVPCNSFREIVDQTLATEKSYGILPIENSITSNVHENMDYLFKEPLEIVSEASLQINLHLIGMKDASLKDIKTVYSHPKALQQCSKFISDHKLITEETTSTAAGRDMILKMNDTGAACIGSKELADNPSLAILSKNIGNNTFNVTRFLVVSNIVRASPDPSGGVENQSYTSERSQVPNGTWKSSIMFTVPHVSGALAKILTEISNAGLTLTKIESRPIPGTEWEYQFWVDLENSEGTLDRQTIMTVLEKTTQTYKIIGMYPRGETYES